MLFKKFWAILCLLSFIVLPMNYLEAAMPRVAVVPFSNKSARQTASIDSVLDDSRDYVETFLKNKKKGKFDVFTRTELQPLLDEMSNNQNADLFDPATAQRFGKMIGAQYLVVGRVTGITNKGSDTIAHLSLRMIEVETARIYLAGRGTGKSKGDIQEALEKAAKDALTGELGMFSDDKK